jgi:geranylgeranyl pyrophosphate synthase
MPCAALAPAPIDPRADLEAAFQRANDAVLAAIRRLLPTGSAPALAAALFAESERGAAVDPRDLERVEAALVAPIRAIAERRGKGWRGCALELCCTAVGGDFTPFEDWLALAELLHVGSLIVDDVEDGSTLRRGGPACHLVHGPAIAINAGTFAYLLPQRLIQSASLPAETKLRLYEEYVGLLRVGHVGQGLDILGLGAMLRAGASVEALAAANDSIHRMKSGWPFRMCARIGAILGGGTEAQIDAVGQFFATLGLAFQRVDDLLDVVGFPGHHAARGEDLREGKVTYPFIQALARLDAPGRAALLADFEGAGRDEAALARVLAGIEASGALEACRAETRAQVRAAWAALAPHLAESPAKAMLAEFAHRVIERFY